MFGFTTGIVMNIKNWYELNIDISNALINKQQIFNLADESYNNRKGGLWTFDHDEINEYFTKDWLNYMKANGLELDVAFAVYRKAGAQAPAHIDCLSNTKNIYSIAINWVLNDNNESYHVWYQVPESEEEPPMWTTGHYKGHSLINYENVEFLTEIDRCYIQQNPVLVRTDIPHNIINNDVRWSISARFKVPNYTPVDGQDITWEEQIKIMQPFIIDSLQ